MDAPENLIWPLLILKKTKKITGKTRFQKLLFLGKKEYDLDIPYKFVKYNYGPYSFDLSEVLTTLKVMGLINVDVVYFNSNDDYQGKEYVYTLTDDGKSQLKDLESKLSLSQKNNLNNLISNWKDKSLKDIINYVYKKYM